jgi:hypothetical protein
MKTMKNISNNTPAAIFGLLLCFLGLIVPFLAHAQFWSVSFDGAPALKPAQFEISLYGAGTYYSIDNNKGTLGYIPGMKLGIGLGGNFDLKLAYGRGFYSDPGTNKLEDSKQNQISITPKFSFLKGHMAFSLPLSVIFYNLKYRGETKLYTYYLVAPRITGSFYYKQYVEFNISPAFDFFIPGQEDDPAYLLGANVGFAFSSNLNRWSVRPEGYVNYLLPTKRNTGGLFYGWGLAFTFNIDFRKGN